jgi:hypothetical protein
VLYHCAGIFSVVKERCWKNSAELLFSCAQMLLSFAKVSTVEKIMSNVEVHRSAVELCRCFSSVQECC